MQYDLVFEGGGAKGMIFVGAMEVFEQRGHTAGRVLGTSAGAITAALLAAGYTPQEMLSALNERDEQGNPVFASFMGLPQSFSEKEIDASVMIGFLRELDIPLVPERAEEKIDQWVAKLLLKNQMYCHLFSFVEKGGWYVANAFVKWLERKLDEKQPGFSDIRLKEFFEATGKELTLIAADTTDSRMLILNHATAPQLKLKMAVRMSMSIPFLWQEVVWDPDWGEYTIGGRALDLTGHAIVDGGLLSNFPIELFVSKDPQVLDVMGHNPSQGAMGLLIDEMLPVKKGSTIQAKRSGLMALNTAQRVMNLVNTMTGAHDKMVIEAFADLVVRLPAGGYGTTEFDMSEERREALVQAGRDAMSAYLNQQMPGTLSGPGTLTPQVRDLATERALDIFSR
ncbi:MAG: patatin-like phospholipase family protein [Ardenticatenaceae bacterium]|nr:patatin-like phospholipase family protein [Ardenticatenaceae bacterium]